MSHRQGAQEECVNQPKGGHGSADTESERENRGGGGSLVFEKLPGTEHGVGGQRFDPWSGARDTRHETKR